MEGGYSDEEEDDVEESDALHRVRSGGVKTKSLRSWKDREEREENHKGASIGVIVGMATAGLTVAALVVYLGWKKICSTPGDEGDD